MVVFPFSIVYPVLVCQWNGKGNEKNIQIKCKDCVRIWTMCSKCRVSRFFGYVSRSAFSGAEYISYIFRFFSSSHAKAATGHKHICKSCCILGFVFRHNFLHLIVSWIVLLFIYRAERHVIITKKFLFPHSHRPHSNVSWYSACTVYGTISYICLLLFFHPFAW